MGATNHKVANPITVIQSLPDRVVGNAQNLKASFDLVGETVRLKHNDLCDYIDSDIATKAEVSGITLGPITSSKLDPSALTADATKLNASTETAFALASGSDVTDALNLLPFARWYGKEAQLNTSQEVGYGKTSQSAIAVFATKVVDDFGTLESANFTKMVIPPGATSVQITVGGYSQNNWSNAGAGGQLYKNGSYLMGLWSASPGQTFNSTVTVSVPVTDGDYLQVYIYGSVVNDTQDSTNRAISKCNSFRMTVLK